MPRNYPIQKYRRKFRSKNAKYRKVRKKGLAAKVKRLAQKVYADQDVRWHDLTNVIHPITRSGELIDAWGLENIIQGDNIGERQGDKIHLKEVSLHSQVFNAVYTGVIPPDNYNTIRLMLVQIEHPDVASHGNLLINQILQPDDMAQQLPYIPSIFSFFKKNSLYKYKILWSKLITTQAQQAGATRVPMVNCNFKYTFKPPLAIQYDDVGAAMPVNRTVCLLAISDSSSIPHPSISYVSRCKWNA